MSGKAYTMKEMKAIVDYLILKKAYAEIKGRKMWMEFEKSEFTDRTWQSLKETFLKRILPDIHNPYYQLSVAQIRSFREGCDVETKLRNKLEIRTVSEDSGTDAENQVATQQPSTSNGKAGEKISGEEPTKSKSVSHHRSSAETIILDHCYDTQNVQKGQESPMQSAQNDKESDNDPSTAKSLRDFITYSEPLTPMLQEVMEDFPSDEEREGSDTETKMIIHEDVNETTKNASTYTSDPTIEISSEADDIDNNIEAENESHIDKNQNKDNENGNTEEEQTSKTDNMEVEEAQEIIASGDASKDKSLGPQQCDHKKDDNTKDKNSGEIFSSNMADQNINKNASQNQMQEVDNKKKMSQNISTQNFTNTTADTLIPNNQEALNTQSDLVNQISHKESQSKQNDKNGRKRANSQGPTNTNEKKAHLVKRSKHISISDTDAGIKRNLKLKAGTKSHCVSFTNICKPKQKRSQISISENKKDIRPHPDIEELAKVSVVANKPDTSVEAASNTDKKHLKDLSITENPCLKSVSLYDEQFTSLRYSMSSDEAIASTNKNQQLIKDKDGGKINMETNETYTLKSSSEMDVQEVKERKKTSPVRTAATKAEKDKVLSNVFGFSSGKAPGSRKRHCSYQNKTARRGSRAKTCSESSEWTSESDAEYVSPPRGRRHKSSRKYLKPKSARVFSLEENGGLFVMHRKKIYPMVKDGKILKKYVTFIPERGQDSEGEDEAYWKLKYMEEKKRTAKLTKLLRLTTAEEQNNKDSTVDLTSEPSSPKKQKLASPCQTKTNPEIPAPQEVVPVEPALPVQPEPQVQKEPVVQKTLKIKISKNNEELEVEGHWSQIHPVLDHVVQIFHKEAETKQNANSPLPSEHQTISSGLTTPLVTPIQDQEVHAKVHKLETEIFQEIEARDKQEERSATPLSVSTERSKSTTRGRGRGRPRSSPRLSGMAKQAPEKQKNGLSVTPESVQVEENVEKPAQDIVDEGQNNVTRRTRTPKRILHENVDKNKSNVINTRTKKAKSLSAEEVDDEADVRYRFPSPPLSTKMSTRSAPNKNAREQRPKDRYFKKSTGKLPSLNNVSLKSIEGSQSYIDSDVSPPNFHKKRKSITLLYNRGKVLRQKSIRRRSQLKCFRICDESSNSCPEIFKTSRSSNEACNSEPLTSLTPEVKIYFKHLDNIDEANPNDRGVPKLTIQDCNSDLCNTDKDLLTTESISDADANSSNVSLPPSPVLSAVENISITKDAINSFHAYDETSEETEECNNNKYKIINMDVSMPLMQQHCALQNSRQNITAPSSNANRSNTVVTDSLLNGIGTVNINQDNPTISDSLHQKLRNLLLENVKTLATDSQVTVDGGDSDQMQVDANITSVNNKGNSKKRCSTPLKRRSNKKLKSKKPDIETFVEEEHTDSCSQGGRKSLPPINYKPSDIQSLICSETATTAKKQGEKKGEKKKDIIKVKIVRPKAKKNSKEKNTEEETSNGQAKSIQTDSGINDTESSILFKELNRSIELIHNHSETCLQADDCVNSVEYVENSTTSVITIDNGSELSSDFGYNGQLESEYVTSIKRDLFTSNDNIFNACTVIEASQKNTKNHECSTYHTPMDSNNSPNSLITEDLSEPEPRTSSNQLSKWYLFSEDENTNTNFANHPNSVVDCGSNLNDIFPIACAVPDLSTITEMSKETENPLDTDGDTRNDLLSQSIFNSNF